MGEEGKGGVSLEEGEERERREKGRETNRNERFVVELHLSDQTRKQGRSALILVPT